jgi:hypothetical protein
VLIEGDSLDHKIDVESRKTKDFLILENHEEAEEELPKKAKYFFSTAVQNWDADFYVKVDDNIDLDLGKFSLLLHFLKLYVVERCWLKHGVISGS